MSNPAALTTASSPLILGLTPFLHYQPAICSEEKGCHFSGPGEAVHSIPEKRTKNVEQALGVRRLVVLGSVPRCVGHSQASLAGAQGAGTRPSELAVSTLGAGRGLQKRRP